MATSIVPMAIGRGWSGARRGRLLISKTLVRAKADSEDRDRRVSLLGPGTEQMGRTFIAMG
jgi:hypothetical protein